MRVPRHGVTPPSGLPKLTSPVAVVTTAVAAPRPPAPLVSRPRSPAPVTAAGRAAAAAQVTTTKTHKPRRRRDHRSSSATIINRCLRAVANVRDVHSVQRVPHICLGVYVLTVPQRNVAVSMDNGGQLWRRSKKMCTDGLVTRTKMVICTSLLLSQENKPIEKANTLQNYQPQLQRSSSRPLTLLPMCFELVT
jgi:hypothetical protein